MRTVEALVILLIAVVTTEVGGGLVPNAAAETVPPCPLEQLYQQGEGPGPGRWTKSKAVKTCDTPSNVLVTNPRCVRVRCLPRQRAECNVCWAIDWTALFIPDYPPWYWVNEAGCLRYACVGMRKR